MITKKIMKKLSVNRFRPFSLLVFALAAFSLLASNVAAQSNGEHSRNTADQTLRSNARINPSTLAMELSIPIGDLPGRGGATMPLVFDYSSKVWQFDTLGQVTRNQVQVDPLYSFNGPRAGWTTSYDPPRIDTMIEEYDCHGNAVTTDSVTPDGCPYNNFYVKKMRIKMPGGTTHELRKDDAVYASTGSPDLTGTYYAVDGTRARFEWSGTHAGILYLPDGGRFFFQDGGTNEPQCYKYIDRHGNTLTYSGTTRAWTDTLGRTLSAPISATLVEETKTITFPGIGGASGANRDYQLVWMKLSSGALIADDQLHYSAKSCVPNGITYDLVLFSSNIYVIPCNAATTKFDPVVLHKIILPNAQEYKFSYNRYGEIARIDYPTGGYERFVYQQIDGISWDYQQDSGSARAYGRVNRGVVDRYVGAGDGATEQHWHYFAGYESSDYGVYVVQTTNPDGTKTRNFPYRARRPDYDIYGSYGFDSILVGMSKDSITLDTNNQMRSRKLTRWEVTSGPNSGYGGVPERDARVGSEASIIFEPGNSYALIALSRNEYDTAGSTDPAYFCQLNLIRTKSYHYAAIPASVAAAAALDWTTIDSYFTNATPAAISESDYLYNANYKARGIVGMATDTRVIDPAAAPANQIKAKSHIDYDETAYLETPISTMMNPSGWTNPQTDPGATLAGIRGLPTTTKAWNDTNNSWITTHVMYDQFGNVRKNWDGKGNVSEIQYTDNYSDSVNRNSYALPTATISYAGANSTGTQFTTSIKYDFSTGLPVATKDANNLETRMEYVDALLRPTKVQQYLNNSPVGAATETVYGAGTSAATRYVKTRAQIDEQKWKEAYAWFDGLGRATKSQSVDAASGDVFALTCYDEKGRLSKVSNPFRNVSNATCASSLEWTTTVYDAATGRAWKTITPDNAVVETNYSLATSGTHLGTIVTIKDQALKERRSITNALGQLVRVDEPTDAGGLGAVTAPNQPTYYDYDTLSNLKTVKQGGTLSAPEQTRTFVYDSLSRLKTATNPESGTIQYQYDNNGNLTQKTDARGVQTIYGYDALNRVTSRRYTNEPTGQLTTPNVTYTYDNLTNAKGKLTKVTTTGTGTNTFSAVTDYRVI